MKYGMRVFTRTTFLAEFCDKYTTLYIYTLKNNHIQAKRERKKKRFKMVTK